MAPNPLIATRSIGDVVGLPTSLAYVLLIVVPILVIGSTLILCFYYIKARSANRERNRASSKSSQATASTDGEAEMALTAIGATFRPPTSTGSEQSFGFIAPTDKSDRRVVAGHVKGSGSEVFDVQQYETERANQRSRDMILPSPTAPTRPRLPSPSTHPIRPGTAPGYGRPQNTYGEFERPMDYNGSNMHNPPAQFNPYLASESNQPEYPNQSRSKLHRRSNSLGKPPPIRPPRPAHSPTSSVRSLSVFPHRHVLPNSPTMSQRGYNSPPPTTPSPPLLSPLSYTSRPQPLARPQQHVRHPSVDRNSFMPIAPILLPTAYETPSSGTVLAPVDERATSPQNHWGYEDWKLHDRWLSRSTKNYI
jgi:hypothetical protein